MSAAMTAQFVTDALVMAIWRGGKPDALLHHSDRGSVVGWSMRAEMMAKLVTDALVIVIWWPGTPDALLHYSDRGSRYTSESFQRLMADNGVICAMSRSGNVWDNAAVESFFWSHKTGAALNEHATKQELTYSTTSHGSTIQNVGIRRSDICAYGVRAQSWISLIGCHSKPGAGQ
jgi:transposase InsO family protein